MSKTKKTKLPEVELLNVPHYRQGSFDGLCCYYTGAMMLVTLFPEYEKQFGSLRSASKSPRVAKSNSADPLISNYKPNESDDRKALATWFHQGEHVRNATTILNRVMKRDDKSTRFRCLDRGSYAKTFREEIAGSINLGLPVMLSWSTRDYGDHAILVTGYWEGHERWFYINDPGDAADQISFDSLADQKLSRFEIGLCKSDKHYGWRPLKRVTHGKVTTVYRWNGEEYVDVREEFRDS
ncbi:MAG: hypothetical protein OXG88_07495 [Gammaproteobacteria bacterium]|nr:hypothetical protein [Gammaproteobacteria bacterium]